MNVAVRGWVPKEAIGPGHQLAQRLRFTGIHFVWNQWSRRFAVFEGCIEQSLGGLTQSALFSHGNLVFEGCIEQSLGGLTQSALFSHGNLWRAESRERRFVEKSTSSLEVAERGLRDEWMEEGTGFLAAGGGQRRMLACCGLESRTREPQERTSELLRVFDEQAGALEERKALGGHPKCTSDGRLKMYQGSVAT